MSLVGLGVRGFLGLSSCWHRSNWTYLEESQLAHILGLDIKGVGLPSLKVIMRGFV